MMVCWKAALVFFCIGSVDGDDFSGTGVSADAGDLREACVLALASEKGYVMVDAIALESAAIRNVASGGGLLRFDFETRSSLRFSKNKNVRDGLSVRKRVAEYPDQNPRIPFSCRISFAILATVGRFRDPDSSLMNDVVCIRVTIVPIGMVINLALAPAMNPTPNSSTTGR